MRGLICVISAISFSLGTYGLADGANLEANYAVNYGKNNKPFYHLLFVINANNLAKLETLSKKQFKQNGGQFEVLLKKGGFPVEAPNCKSDLILRMPWVVSPFDLAEKYRLYKNIARVAHNLKGSVPVSIELNPYVTVQGNKLILTKCNIYFRHANSQYIPHIHNIN